MSDKNQNVDDFDGADVPTYHGDKNSPLASDAPTTIFRPAASSGVSDYDPSAMPAHPSAHTPRGYADPPPYEEQPTVALSFSQSDRAAAAAGTDPNAYAPTEVAPPVEPTAPVDLSGDPYAAPADSYPAQAYPPADVADGSQIPQQDMPAEPVGDARRGTMDFGIFLIRAVASLYLILDSVSVFFQLGGNSGIPGLEHSYSGYAYPGILSIAIPSAELAAGVFLFLGLITPVSAAVGTIVAAFTFLHTMHVSTSGLSIFGADSTLRLSALMLVVLVGLQFTGPGKISFDMGRGWTQRPLASSWIFVVLGLGGAAALWWFGAGVNPLS